MIETAIYNKLKLDIPDSVIYWGKLSKGTKFDGVPIINFFKVPSQASNFMPTYLDRIQFNVRHEYIDKSVEYSNKLISIFQGFYGDLDSYQIRIVDIAPNGSIYEKEDIVNTIVTIGIKYTGL